MFQLSINYVTSITKQNSGQKTDNFWNSDVDRIGSGSIPVVLKFPITVALVGCSRRTTQVAQSRDI